MRAPDAPTGRHRRPPSALIEAALASDGKDPQGQLLSLVSGLAGLAAQFASSREPGKASGAVLIWVVVIVMLGGALFWGLHEVLGGTQIEARLDRQDERIDRLERAQERIQWSLDSIAQAVGAKIPKEPRP